jgi:2-haloacid dehalogenase/putative hydrolase of the HAD superfamily
VRKYEALFIDFYGTVTAGDRQAVEDTCRNVVASLGLSMRPVQLAEAWGRRFFARIEEANHAEFKSLFELEVETLVDTVGPLVKDFDPHPFARQLKGYWSNPPLQPEALEALRTVSIPICCVSNADTADVLAAVERHGLRFDCVVTSEDARCYKPDGGIFEVAMKAMGVSPANIMHVGDSLHSDIGGAKRVGIKATWICRGDRIFDVGEEVPDHKIRSLMELEELLT